VAKVPITERTIRLRLRVALQAQGKRLRVTSSQQLAKSGLGRYYLVGAKGVIDPDVDLEAFARELGTLQSWETLKPSAKNRLPKPPLVLLP
jgi:hypothetical protein